MNSPAEKKPENKAALLTGFMQDSVLQKIGTIVILVLILLIPLAMINSILDERLERRDTTVKSITDTWGKQQTLVGPVLIIPYLYSVKTWRDEVITEGDKQIKQRKEVTEQRIAKAYFLPDMLDITGELQPNQLHRGIYDAIVYKANLKLTGQFKLPNLAVFNISMERILWEDAKISLALSDLRGTQETLILKLNNQAFPLVPGGLVPHYQSGIQANIAKALNLNQQDQTLDFSLDIGLNGSSRLEIAPLGISNKITLNSSWQDPNFDGAFLPTEREISNQGFKANWRVSYYGRNYPQQWTELMPQNFSLESIKESFLGVTLVPPIDSYRHVERSIKYGVLFMTLVFTAFFLFEVLGERRIHPFQYFLVGMALCLFYLALLSFSEFIAFAWSYVIAACASTVLISLYSFSVLKSGQRTILMAVGLVLTYGFLYITLQATDYALLIGTFGLFLALSLVMYATRDIDWYARNNH